MSNIEVNRIIKQKKQKLLSLKDKLTELISKRDHLLVTKKGNLEALYTLKIGRYEYKLMETECEVARLKRKIELIQVKVNRGKDIDLEEVEKVLDKEYREWEQKIKDMVERVKKADSRLKSLLSSEDSRLLQKLYRKLVKLLHPDINQDAGKEENILWQRLQDAYRNGDLEEIKLIDLLVGQKDKVVELDTEEKLDKVITDYGEKIRKLSDEIVNILSSFPFDIEEKLKDKDWVKSRVEEISEKIMEKVRYAGELRGVVDGLIIKNIGMEEVEG